MLVLFFVTRKGAQVNLVSSQLQTDNGQKNQKQGKDETWASHSALGFTENHPIGYHVQRHRRAENLELGSW